MQHKPFQPAWWLPNGHLQTLFPPLYRKPDKSFTYARERFELPDGDFIDLDWVGSGTGPLVLILHGLEGSIQSPYASGMLSTIQKLGWRGVLMNFRGCSGEINRNPRTYHSGETEDLACVVNHLTNKLPNTPILAIGYSLGGNVLLKWLGETGHSNPLSAAVTVSVPFELHKAAKRLQCGFSKVYQRHLMYYLLSKTRKKLEQHPGLVSSDLLKQLRTIWDFDDKITAPLNGFKDAEDYYSKSSSRQYLKHITVPTLLIQAKDDPFMTEDLLPHAHELSSSVQFELTEYGGHVGFIAGGWPWEPEYWLEERIPKFIIQNIKHI